MDLDAASTETARNGLSRLGWGVITISGRAMSNYWEKIPT
jgi:hypothetical protein